VALIADNPEVQNFKSEVISALSSGTEIEHLFKRHVESGFLEHFVLKELAEVASSPNHLVSGAVGQLDFGIVNHPMFSYTVRLVLPVSADTPRSLRWQGDSQFIGVKGPGLARFRTLSAPIETDINVFQRGVKLEILGEGEVSHGGFVTNSSPFGILDLARVLSPVILEIMTIRGSAELHWRFDGDLSSEFAEEAHVTTSRVKNLFNLATRMGRPIPSKVHSSAITGGNVQLRLAAIQALLVSGDEDAFHELRLAMESDHRALARGAQAILDTMTSRTCPPNTIGS